MLFLRGDAVGPKPCQRGLILAVLAIVCIVGAGQLTLGGSAVPSPKGDPPVVTMNAHGCPVLTLTAKQHASVAKFLQTHPQMDLYDYSSAEYGNGACLETYKEWLEAAKQAKADPQYPFAVWGDFNRDGYLDFVLFLVSKKPAVTHKWPMNGKFVYTYDYDWWIVVFQGSTDGTFTPVIAGRDRWSNFMDGVIFQPERHRIEYWVKSAGGSVEWTGTAYRQERLKSLD